MAITDGEFFDANLEALGLDGWYLGGQRHDARYRGYSNPPLAGAVASLTRTLMSNSIKSITL
jgi:hypothetical protein